MRIKEVENLLTEWFKRSYKGEILPINLIDEDFVIEDDMVINDYWNYECQNFKEISNKYGLDENLYAKIKTWEPYGDDINKNLVLVYVYNSKNQFSFKVTVTVAYKKYRYLISSNNSTVQMVAKHVVENDVVSQLGLAILTRDDVELKDIYCKTLHKVYLEKSPSFDGEVFYSARFSSDSFNHVVDSFVNFRLYLKDIKTGKLYFENRKAIFDAFDPVHKPYSINGEIISLNDETYPVGLMTIKNGIENLQAYPRNTESINLKKFNKVIITDAQDNDWIL